MTNSRWITLFGIHIYNVYIVLSFNQNNFMKQILETILLKQILVSKKLKIFDRESSEFRRLYICSHGLKRLAIISINLVLFEENE